MATTRAYSVRKSRSKSAASCRCIPTDILTVDATVREPPSCPSALYRPTRPGNMTDPQKNPAPFECTERDCPVFRLGSGDGGHVWRVLLGHGDRKRLVREPFRNKDLVDQPVILGLGGGEEAVAGEVARDRLVRLVCVLRHQPVTAFLEIEQIAHVDLDIGGVSSQTVATGRVEVDG